MSYKHQWEDEGVHVIYFDELKSEDIIKSNSVLVGNPKYNKIKYILSDFENITSAGVSDVDVEVSKLFAVNSSDYNKNVRVALISSNKMLQALIEQYINKTLVDIPGAQQKLFDNLSEARQWVLT